MQYQSEAGQTVMFYIGIKDGKKAECVDNYIYFAVCYENLISDGCMHNLRHRQLVEENSSGCGVAHRCTLCFSAVFNWEGRFKLFSILTEMTT